MKNYQCNTIFVWTYQKKKILIYKIALHYWSDEVSIFFHQCSTNDKAVKVSRAYQMHSQIKQNVKIYTKVIYSSKTNTHINTK